jgi:hypothetical protein
MGIFVLHEGVQMNIRIFATGAAALATTLCVPAIAQVPVTAVAPPSGNLLPSNTELLLSTNREVNSKSVKEGQKFELSVARDVMLGNYIVIPRGTRGWGQISYRTGKGAFGKSAKMEFDLTEIELGGRHIPISGHYRVEGQGNTGAAVGAVVAVGPFGAFVTGRSAVITQGTEYKGYTREQLAVALPDGGATMQPAVAPAPVTATVIQTSAPTPSAH